jgi:hypothetical protein
MPRILAFVKAGGSESKRCSDFYGLKKNVGDWPKAMLTVAWGKRSAAPGFLTNVYSIG